MAQFLIEPTPHTEAAKLIADKPVVVRSVFDELLPEIKGRVFTITGIEQANVLQAVRDQIATLPQGADWNTIKHQIANDISPFIDDATKSDAENQQAAQARAELLLRVHGFQAYSACNERIIERQADVFPFCEYVTVGDERVRPTHAALDGLIVPTNSPFWDKHTPPWGYGCRCQKVGRSSADVGKLKTADKKLNPEQRRVMEGPVLQKLQEGSVTRTVEIGGKKMTQTFNVAPATGPTAFSATPGDLRIPLDQLKGRYDPDIFAGFESWAKKQQLDELGKSVWEWLGGAVRQPGDWPALADLAKVQDLGGSTGAELVRDKDTGTHYVLKCGNSVDHLRNEALADSLYRVAGVNVPKLTVLETPHGTAKLSEFIEGQPLSAVLKSAGNTERAAVLKQLQGNFVVDALLGNYDVIGLALDNIVVDANGVAWRIDNGGSFFYRAQGALKTAFSGEVTELATMRDAKVNPSAARIFSGIPETQIQDQIAAVLEKRDAILAVIDDPKLKAVMNARFDDLARRIKTPGIDNAITPAFAQAVEKSRIVGRTLRLDRGDIEDTQALLWTEKTADDKPVTRLKLKLTPDGADAVMTKLRDSLPASKKGAPDLTLREDKFWPKIEAALKTVNHHAGDGSYNAMKLEELKAVKSQVEALKDSGNVGLMKKQYLKIIDTIDAAVNSKTVTPQYAQFKKAPTAKKTVKATFHIQREEIQYFAKQNDRGFARQGTEKVWENGSQFVIKLDQGVTVRFTPFEEAGGATFNAPFAFRGYIEASVPGAAAPSNIQAVADALRSIGLDTTPVTAEYTELMYLRKNFALRPDVVPAIEVDKICNDNSVDDASKIVQLKALAKEKLGITLPAKPTTTYDPNGKANSFGEGWIRTERFDLPAATVRKEMKDYTLHHHSQTALPELINSLLNGGGDFTCTTERLRKGIPIRQGMSPEQDLNTGGANYLFTRIKKAATRDVGLAFKPELLARQDTISYERDYFGDVTNATQIAVRRAKTIDDFKRYAMTSSNETILKWGVNILDDLHFINAGSDAERAEILEVFHQHGYQALPDGRKLEDLIKVKGRKG